MHNLSYAINARTDCRKVREERNLRQKNELMIKSEEGRKKITFILRSWS